ncbi:MAG: hypothetical protein J0I12_05820 [Candidatus Eremiobacteraeota bacterium]|nr:hypothetical protein [Candidatus Eremiobacteraeota bacterium]
MEFSKLSQDEQRRLLDKLAKLKALSNCATGNANETATAAATMARIMLEYEIEMADLDIHPSEADLTVLKAPLDEADTYRGFPAWQTALMSCLAEIHHCIAYLGTEPEMWTTGIRYRQTRNLIGTHQDIENVRRLFTFCVNEIERLSRVWEGARSQKHRNDFKLGACRGVCDQVRSERARVMQEQRERAKSMPSRALELFDRKEKASREFARAMGMGSRSTSASRGVYADAYGAGYEAGSQLNLDQSSPRKALPSGR